MTNCQLSIQIISDPASCDYWRFGAGGRQENINAICILNLNIINDKVRGFRITPESESPG